MNLVFCRRGWFMRFFILVNRKRSPAAIQSVAVEKVTIAGECLLAVNKPTRRQLLYVLSGAAYNAGMDFGR